MRLLLVAGAVALLAGSVQAAEAGRWVGAWGASPAPPEAASPSFANQTIVQVVRLSAGGDRLRVRLTNEYGARPLDVGAARIALVNGEGQEVAGSAHPLTFGGRREVQIPPGAPMLSDPVPLPTGALSTVRIAVYLPGETGPCTCHPLGVATVQVSPTGDFTDRPFEPAGTTTQRPFLSGVEVETARAAGVIVALGDSITDGMGSTPNANRRWPDLLAERLAKADPARPMAVVNAGISGNRVLSDGSSPRSGQSALSRFDRDVLSVPGATHVILLEGVNDIGRGPPTAEALIAGYQQVIARAKAQGLTVIGATILPYEGAGYFRPEGEKVRQAVNAWIRQGGAFDHVVDLDAVTRDPRRPSRLRAEFHDGDWLHPNDAGYRAMADAFDLRLFR